MKRYGIVTANGGFQLAIICADSMENALLKFAKKMPHWAYRTKWYRAHIGCPYIVTDMGISFTAFEY